MTADGWASLFQWLIGGLIAGIGVLITVIIRLTLDVRELTTTIKHQDQSIVAVKVDLVEHKKDTRENFDHVWEHTRAQDKAIGEIDRRVTRLEPKGTR